MLDGLGCTGTAQRIHSRSLAVFEVCDCCWPMLRTLQASRQVISHCCSIQCRVSSLSRLPALRQKRFCPMPMRRTGSADLPAGAKLPATHAEASKGHKHGRRQPGFGVWDYYNRQLSKQPVITKGLTCFFGERTQHMHAVKARSCTVSYSKHRTQATMHQPVSNIASKIFVKHSACQRSIFSNGGTIFRMFYVDHTLSSQPPFTCRRCYRGQLGPMVYWSSI